MDDISQDLKDMAHIIDMAQGKAEVIMTSGSMLDEAHQEIERLRAIVRSQEETNADDTVTNDSVKEIAQYLEELSKAYWLSDDDCRALAQASQVLLYLQRDISIKSGLLKGWDYRLNRAEEQLAEAHGILGSEAMIRLFQEADHQQDWMVSIVAPVSDYWERYGNAYDQRRSL